MFRMEDVYALGKRLHALKLSPVSLIKIVRHSGLNSLYKTKFFEK